MRWFGLECLFFRWFLSRLVTWFVRWFVRWFGLECGELRVVCTTRKIRIFSLTQELEISWNYLM